MINNVGRKLLITKKDLKIRVRYDDEKPANLNKRQRKLQINYNQCRNKERARQLKSERNKILRSIKKQLKALTNEALQRKAEVTERCKHESAKMYKAAKELMGKIKEPLFVADKKVEKIARQDDAAEQYESILHHNQQTAIVIS